jgi:hypothetical protein
MTDGELTRMNRAEALAAAERDRQALAELLAGSAERLATAEERAEKAETTERFALAGWAAQQARATKYEKALRELTTPGAWFNVQDALAIARAALSGDTGEGTK